MKKNLVFPVFGALFMLLSLSSFAQSAKKETRQLTSFSQVHVSGSFDVYLKQGSSEEVTIEVKGIELDEIETEVSGNTLKIGKKKNNNNWGSWNKQVTIWVTYRSIDALSSSGASDIVTESVIRAPEFKVKSSGSGDMELEIETEKLDLSMSGSSDIEIRGKAREQSISLTGSGDVDAFSLTTDKTYIRISGSGDVAVAVEEELEARISGSGDVRYKGSPGRQNVSVSGSGNVSQVN